MKTNDYLLLSTVAAYSFLFFSQNAGINYLLFSVFLIIILIIKNKNVVKESKWCWAAVMALLTGVCVFIHSSALSILANIVSLMLLSAFSYNGRTSAIFSFFFSICTAGSSLVFVIIDSVVRASKPSPEKNGKNFKWLGIIIVVVISLLFFLMYRKSNPLFAEYTKWINLDFLSLSWIFFTLGGFLLMYSFIYHKSIPPIETWENNLNTRLSETPVEEKKLNRMETEKTSIIILFVLLNLMLLVISIGDVNTLFLGGKLPAGVKHSDFVHSGVGMLMLSIVLAISLIMYFLRGALNFYKGNRFFKLLVILWILQNLLMLASTSYRNHLYISEYTLTYKRIGVYVWLALSVIGLCITAVKVYFSKTNWYLVKNNFAVWFTVLSLSAVIDWDLLITRYNLQNKKINEIDYVYLFSMSDTALPELIEFSKQKVKTHSRAHLNKNGPGGKDYYNYELHYLYLLHNKVEDYLVTYKDDWRSCDLRDQRIMKSITGK